MKAILTALALLALVGCTTSAPDYSPTTGTRHRAEVATVAATVLDR